MSDKTQAHVEGANGAHMAVIEASATDGKITLLDKEIIKKDQDGIRTSLVKLDASIQDFKDSHSQFYG